MMRAGLPSRGLRPRARSSERGATAVELAIVFPLLLLLVGGTLEIGRLYFARSSLAQAVQAGTRVASLERTGSEAEVTAAVVRAAWGAGLTAPGVTVTVNGGSTAFADRRRGDTVRVTAHAPYKPVFTFVLQQDLDLTTDVETVVE